MREVLAPAAHLPDAVVGLVPDVLQMRDQRALERPAASSSARPAAAPDVQRVQHLAVDVELHLPRRGVADAHRRGALVAGQPGHLVLVQPPFAGHAVHDLQVVGAARDRAHQPRAPCLGLVEKAQRRAARTA